MVDPITGLSKVRAAAVSDHKLLRNVLNGGGHGAFRINFRSICDNFRPFFLPIDATLLAPGPCQVARPEMGAFFATKSVFVTSQKQSQCEKGDRDPF